MPSLTSSLKFRKIDTKVKERASMMAELISYPPLVTGYTNPDGKNLYKSKLTVILVIPSIFSAIFFAFAYFYPLFY